MTLPQIKSLALKQEINALRLEVHALQKNRSLIGWLYPTLSAAFTAVFTYLIIQYFTNNQ